VRLKRGAPAGQFRRGIEPRPSQTDKEGTKKDIKATREQDRLSGATANGRPKRGRQTTDQSKLTANLRQRSEDKR